MKNRNSGGYILVTVAILLIFMLALTALAVDIGMAYSARTQNQAAADAGALAGAATLLDSSNLQPTTLINEAKKVAAANKTMGAVINETDVTVSPFLTEHRVKVEIDRDEPTFFAKVVGFNSVHVHTTAIAEAAIDKASGGPCMKPFFIPSTLGNMMPCGAGGACAIGHVLFAGNPPRKTAYADSIRGNEYVMKPQSPGGAINPSDFYALNIGGGGGGAMEFSKAIGECIDDATLACQLSYNVKTGDMRGPTIDGVNELIGGPPPADTYVGLSRYRHPDGHIYTTSRALVSAPVVDLCGYPGFCPMGQLPPGAGTNLKVIGFAVFFVESVGQSGANRGDVLGRFIDAFPCGTSPTPDVSGSPVFGVPLRLVRP